MRISIFRKYTKWLPLGTYNYAYENYVTFVRKDLKTGMLYFKTKNICNIATSNSFVNLIDTSKQWELINNQEDAK